MMANKYARTAIAISGCFVLFQLRDWLCPGFFSGIGVFTMYDIRNSLRSLFNIIQSQPVSDPQISHSFNIFSVVKYQKTSFSQFDKFSNFIEIDQEFLVSFRLLLILILSSAVLGYAIGRLKSKIVRRKDSEFSSLEESRSPLSNGDDIQDKSMEMDGGIEFYDCLGENEKCEHLGMIDNTNFFKNFIDQTMVSSNSKYEIFTAEHVLDKGTYMIKKIKISLDRNGELQDNLLVKEIISLTKVNSKYIGRYITSWLEETSEISSFHLYPQKKLLLCIQMEMYTDKILKEWLGLGIPNKILCNKIFKQVAKAVKHIHDKEIFHGKLNTKNICLDRARNIKVINFCMGKQCRDEANGRKKKDILALAMILVQLFMQFESKEQRKIALAKMRDEGVVPEEIKKNFDEVNKIVQIMVNDPGREGLIDMIIAHRLINIAI